MATNRRNLRSRRKRNFRLRKVENSASIIVSKMPLGSKIAQDPHPPPLPPYRYFSPFGYARSLEFRTAALTLRSPQTNHNGSN